MGARRLDVGTAAGGASSVFVTGMERSGTRLLRTVLSAHAMIAPFPQSFVPNLIKRWRGGVRDGAELDAFLGELYTRTRFGKSPVPRGVLADRFGPRLPLGFPALAHGVVAAYSESQGKAEFTLWGDASPTFVRFLHTRRRLLDEVFGSYRVISIIRDGRAVLSSVLRAHAIRGGKFSTDVVELAARWRVAATLSSAVADPKVYHELRYEDLVSRPEETLRHVCTFLGVPFDVGMLDYRRLARVTPIHQLLAAPLMEERATAWQLEAPPQLLRIFDLLCRVELAGQGYGALPPSVRRSRMVVLGELLAYRLNRYRRRLSGKSRALGARAGVGDGG